jgi:hypothetical protein
LKFNYKMFSARGGNYPSAPRGPFSVARGENCFFGPRREIFPSGANDALSRKPKKREKFAGVRPQTY